MARKRGGATSAEMTSRGARIARRVGQGLSVEIFVELDIPHDRSALLTADRRTGRPGGSAR